MRHRDRPRPEEPRGCGQGLAILRPMPTHTLIAMTTAPAVALQCVVKAKKPQLI